MQDLADSNAYHFTLNDGGMFLQNICVAPHHYTISQRKRSGFESASP